MKKRIEKLFNEAGFHKPEVERLGVEHKFEKFAELIVWECLNKIENEAAQYSEPVWAVELMNDIKEHFGVEEK
jgi:hypothetical protein